jgi:flagellar basal-body rod protein FlgG
VLRPEISVPDDALEIALDPEGRCRVRTAGSPYTSTLLSQIMLHRFVNPDGLLAVGANLLRPSEVSGTAMSNTPGAQGLGLLKQGCIERSNVRSPTTAARSIGTACGFIAPASVLSQKFQSL